VCIAAEKLQQWMMMCYAVWLPNLLLHSSLMTDCTRAWNKKALKLFFSVCNCTAKAISRFRSRW
jgi:hypothetical protein